MKHLFDPASELWNTRGAQYSSLTHTALRPIIEQAVKENVSLRELFFVLSSQVWAEICWGLLSTEAYSTKEKIK